MIFISERINTDIMHKIYNYMVHIKTYHMNWYDIPFGQVVVKIKSILSESTKDKLFGKNRKNPCEKCGNPHHSTDEHKWYH